MIAEVDMVREKRSSKREGRAVMERRVGREMPTEVEEVYEESDVVDDIL